LASLSVVDSAGVEAVVVEVDSAGDSFFREDLLSRAAVLDFFESVVYQPDPLN